MWKWLKESVAHFVANCHVCGVAKSHFIKPEGPNKRIEITRPNQFIFLDHYGPLPSNEGIDDYKFVLVILEGYSKFVKCYPVKDTMTEEVPCCVRSYVEHYSQREKIENTLSDNGSCFGKEYKEALLEMGIHPSHISPYSPYVNCVERIMSCLGDYLRVWMYNDKHQNHLPWILYLQDIEDSINEMEHGVTGCIPAEAMTGQAIKDEVPEYLKLPVRTVELKKIQRQIGKRLESISKCKQRGFDECRRIHVGDLVRLMRNNLSN